MMDAYVGVDALYLTPKEEGVSYAIVDERVENPDCHARWGYKAKIGAFGGEDCWRIELSFLHYHARTISSVHGDILPTWGHPLSSSLFSGTAAELWRLHLGFADLTLGKCFCVSPCLELAAWVGLRYAEVRHKIKVDYGVEELCFKNKFWGGGLQFGMESLWRLCDWLKLYSRGAGSLVMGRFYVHQDIPPVKLYNQFHQLQQMLEGGVGLNFCFGAWTFRAGWELYLLFDQNQLVHFVDRQPGKFVSQLGDLSMQGLLLSLKFLF